MEIILAQNTEGGYTEKWSQFCPKHHLKNLEMIIAMSHVALIGDAVTPVPKFDKLLE